jgi:hypothetical protein
MIRCGLEWVHNNTLLLLLFISFLCPPATLVSLLICSREMTGVRLTRVRWHRALTLSHFPMDWIPSSGV